jgi:hypothetical protein
LLTSQNCSLRAYVYEEGETDCHNVIRPTDLEVRCKAGDPVVKLAQRFRQLQVREVDKLGKRLLVDLRKLLQTVCKSPVPKPLHADTKTF